MECHRDVIVFRPPRPVGIPAIAQVIGFHHRKPSVNRRLVIRQASALKTELHHNGKVVPVAVRHLRMGALVEPCVQVYDLAPGEVRGEFIPQQGKPQTVGRHLDQTLIVGAGFAPVTVTVRIGAEFDRGKVFFAKGAGIAGCQQRKQPP